jgi:hypothetical protein
MPLEPDDIKDIKDALKRVEDALLGDPGMGHRGLVERLAEVERELAVIKADRATEAAERRGAKWVVVGGASLAGGLGGLVSWVVSTFGSGRNP